METLHPQLQTLIAELDSVTARAQLLAKEGPGTVLIQKPHEGIWSAVDCLEHLNITTRQYLPIIDEALHGAVPITATTPARFRKDTIGWLLTWMMEPPYRMKMKTPSPFVPASTLDKNEVFNRFFELQSSLRERISRSAKIDLSKTRITSPFNGNAKYNLYSAFCILLAHQRRHLWQAEQVRRIAVES